MPHPISTTYLDQQTARASAALPGAGAFDAAPIEMYCPGFDHVTLFVTYTRGAAGGAVTLRPEFSPDSAGTAWFRMALYDPAIVAAGTDAASLVQRETVAYGATAGGAQTFVFGPIPLSGTIERLRVACAESGVVGTPGTCAILARYASINRAE
jgi:hypothetical protein